MLMKSTPVYSIKSRMIIAVQQILSMGALALSESGTGVPGVPGGPPHGGLNRTPGIRRDYYR
jgi:hypothetical protein